MAELTRDQFRVAVAAALSSVHHMYREIDRLTVGLREALAEEPPRLEYMRAVSGKSGRDQSRLVVRNEFPLLFRASELDEGEDEDDDEYSIGDDGEEEEEEARKSTPTNKHPKIVADETLLAVRIAVYDPRKGDVFEPQVQYAVLQDWTVNTLQPPPVQSFGMQRRMLRLIPRAIGSNIGAAKGARINTGVTVTHFPGAQSKGIDG